MYEKQTEQQVMILDSQFFTLIGIKNKKHVKIKIEKQSEILSLLKVN
jgi:hypothetical protein